MSNLVFAAAAIALFLGACLAIEASRTSRYWQWFEGAVVVGLVVAILGLGIMAYLDYIPTIAGAGL